MSLIDHLSSISIVDPEPVDNGKRLFVRPTRPGEQFNDNDKFIAWYEGDAAGTMSETAEAAAEKLRSFQERAEPKFVEPSTRLLNEASLRAHALDCSKRFRAGKFTRVGQDFIDEVHADVEALIRELRNKWPTTVHEPIVLNNGLVTGLLCDKVKEALNGAIARLIQNKVQRQPTVGKTLGRTR